MSFFFLGRCWPWRHVWFVTRVTPPVWDPRAKGWLWTCLVCEKVKAR